MPQKKSGHVTLTDVADASGLSVSTVSVVLSEAPLSQNIAAATRERVRAVASRLGYHPDAHARSLRRRSTQTIGVLVFDLSDPFCIPIMHGIQSGLHTAKYLPLVLDAQTQRKLFDHYLHLVLERRAEGLIVIASGVFEETDLLADVQKNNVPILIVGRDLTSRGIDSILVDNEAGGALAMQHLCTLRHRKIAVIRGPQGMCDSEPRWRGIQRIAAETCMVLDPALVFELPMLAALESEFEGGRRFAAQMVATGRAFSAVLAFDDLTALGVVRGLSEAGVRVPEDCSVIGFDDVLPARLATPAMTTIRQPLHEMGFQAAERMLLAVRSAGTRAAEKGWLMKASPEMVVRGSTRVRRGRKAAK